MNFTQTMLNTRRCILDGFDGPKEAWCYPLRSPDAPSHLIVSNDQKIKINVGKRIVEFRFTEYEKPTFYYS